MKHLLLASALFFCSALSFAQSSGGTYLPTANSSTSLINPIPQQAMYMRTDSIVHVSGHIFLNGFPTVGVKVQIQVSVPFPTDFSSPSTLIYGLGTVFQSTNGQALAVVQTNFANVNIVYTPTSSNPANLTYFFDYLIH
jgi:hypothetical protein